jgi:tetratricopeptide (TPR) repeat protein
LHYQFAVTARPSDAGVHSNYGNVLCDLGRLREGLALYERALQLDPRYPEASNNQGRVLRALGELDATSPMGAGDGTTYPRRQSPLGKERVHRFAALDRAVQCSNRFMIGCRTFAFCSFGVTGIRATSACQAARMLALPDTNMPLYAPSTPVIHPMTIQTGHPS